jgi:hypothetical protein
VSRWRDEPLCDKILGEMLSGLFARCCAGLIVFSAHAFGMQASDPSRTGAEGGASAIWIFANLSFAGMRAQDKGNPLWVILTFIFGLPGTLLTLLVVKKGGERAYGIDLPRKPETR